MAELVHPERFAARLRTLLEEKNRLLVNVYEAQPRPAAALIAEYGAYADFLRPFVTDTASLVYAAACKDRSVLFEGAQGTLLDVDLGTYPYVTSSHPIAGGACLGTGIGPTFIDGVIGVAKSYTTRVGAGVFPTELPDEIGNTIRERGREYGTTTGRPRRCGWLDTVILRYSAQVNGMTWLALGHLDVLSGLDEVKIGVGYRTGDGELLRHLPSDLSFRDDITPEYETLPGWPEDVSGARSLSDLPENAVRYVRRVEELVGVPLTTLSVGPDREQTIVLYDPR
jgi:adenylosuccinate synthase